MQCFLPFLYLSTLPLRAARHWIARRHGALPLPAASPGSTYDSRAECLLTTLTQRKPIHSTVPINAPKDICLRELLSDRPAGSVLPQLITSLLLSMAFSLLRQHRSFRGPAYQASKCEVCLGTHRDGLNLEVIAGCLFRLSPGSATVDCAGLAGSLENPKRPQDDKRTCPEIQLLGKGKCPVITSLPALVC